MKRAKQLSNLFFLPVAITAITLTTGCENDLKDIQKISANEVSKPIERYTDVDVIYSDSAKVKGRMQAPLLMQYTGAKAYNEMPKGVKVIFYDNDLTEKGTLTSDYALSHTDEDVQFRKNVVARNAKGETFKSEELIWDQKKKMMNSSKLVTITMANGDVVHGTGFQSDQNFVHWTMNQSTAILTVTDAPTTPQ